MKGTKLGFLAQLRRAAAFTAVSPWAVCAEAPLLLGAEVQDGGEQGGGEALLLVFPSVTSSCDPGI